MSDDCPELCWAFRHFDWCKHTMPAPTQPIDPDIERQARIDRIFDRD